MKNGVPRAQLAPLAPSAQRRAPAHALALAVQRLDQEFDEPDPRIDAMFGAGM